MNNSLLTKVFLEEWNSSLYWFNPILMDLEQFQAGVIPNKQNFWDLIRMAPITPLHYTHVNLLLLGFCTEGIFIYNYYTLKNELC